MNLTTAQQQEEAFARCKIRPDRMIAVQTQAERIKRGRARYANVASAFKGMPWWVPGILHSLECDLNFKQHLHNGDSLSARTVHVPKGRPVEGKPPFVWEFSAMDALRLDSFDKVTCWSVGNALSTFEWFNGLGYRKRGVPSPYLWSFTDLYKAGKYTSDGIFDPKAVSQQCGCAALLKLLISS